jgi:ribonuclease-3
MDERSGEALAVMLRAPRPEANRVIRAYVAAYNSAAGNPSSERWGVSGEDWYRYAFLGDRVLNLIISEALFVRQDAILNKGRMTKILAGIVSNGSLDVFMKRTGLIIDPLIPATIDVQKKRGERVTGTAFEAFVGALYCVSGFDDVSSFITSLFDEEIRRAGTGDNPVGDLQEYFQKRGLPLPVYGESGRDGPDHCPVFTFRVTTPDGMTSEGRGRSTDEARRDAARAALAAIRKTDP